MIPDILNSTWFVKFTKYPNMDKSKKHYAKWEKPDTNVTSYTSMIAFTWNSRKN